MAKTEQPWDSALAEHEEVIAALSDAANGFDVATWRRSPQSGKWSPAAVVLHVCQSYEFGRDAVALGADMKLLVSPPIAWLSRTVLLPWFLAAKRFPRGARAPREVVPDIREAERYAPGQLVNRLRRSGRDAVHQLRHAALEDPRLRVRHAYFGPLSPLLALRLLSAHTRHHTRALVG